MLDIFFENEAKFIQLFGIGQILTVYIACPPLKAIDCALNYGYTQIGLFGEVIVNGSVLDIQSAGDVFVAEAVIAPVEKKILGNIQNLFFCINFGVQTDSVYLLVGRLSR